MKKLLSTIAVACLSFSCFAEDYFVKVANDEYVLQQGKNIKEEGEKTFTVQVYTPTHVFTYPDGDPAHFRDIQKIDYTKSKVTFVKDIKNRKCCIDIYDDKRNSNKCRIIGTNGVEMENSEIYEVEREANSFTDSKSRLIYIDITGLYIVEKEKNPISNFYVYHHLYRNDKYFLNKSSFKGDVIEISSIDGKREAIGFGKDQKEIFAFNCPSDAPVSFEIEATPVMKQIEEITGVKLVTPPPSEEAALLRMAEILDILPVELLVIDDRQVKLASQVRIIPSNSLPSFGQNTTSLGFGLGVKQPSNTAKPSFGNLRSSNITFNDPFKKLDTDVWVDNPLIDKLKGIIGVSVKKSVITKKMLEKVRDYKFDTSPEAQQRRKELALKPWDEE